MLSANFKPKRTAAASCGFHATARLSCFLTSMLPMYSLLCCVCCCCSNETIFYLLNYFQFSLGPHFLKPPCKCEILYSNQHCKFSRALRWPQYKINTRFEESRAVARKPRDATAVVFGLKFADNIHYKFKSQASKAMLQSSKRTDAKQNLTQNGHSRSRVLESEKRR